MNFYMPTLFVSKENVLQDQKELFVQMGKKALVVTGKNSAKVSGALDDLDKVFKELEIEYEIFDDIIPNPLMKTCVVAGRQARRIRADFVVGIGGGSILDSTKVIALVGANPELTEETIYKKEWTQHPLPSVLIGLTAGTGSEVTDVSVMTNKEGLKKSIHDPILFATVALGDPKYMESLPYGVTTSTAVDAFAHAFESYFSKKANDLSRAFSIQCIRLLWPKLVALQDKEVSLTLEQRQTLYDASILGGLAIGITGTIFAHNVGYFLTENYDVPHGFACATFAQDVLERQLETDPDYVQTFLDDLHLTKDELVDVISSLVPDYEITLTKQQVKELLPRWDGNGTVNNTRGGMPIDKVEEVLMRKFVKD